MVKNRIREIRIKRNVTLVELSKYIGISKVALRAYEDHKFDPKISNVVKILEFFNLEFWDLFYIAEESKE